MRGDNFVYGRLHVKLSFSRRCRQLIAAQCNDSKPAQVGTVHNDDFNRRAYRFALARTARAAFKPAKVGKSIAFVENFLQSGNFNADDIRRGGFFPKSRPRSNFNEAYFRDARDKFAGSGFYVDDYRRNNDFRADNSCIRRKNLQALKNYRSKNFFWR